MADVYGNLLIIYKLPQRLKSLSHAEAGKIRESEVNRNLKPRKTSEDWKQDFHPYGITEKRPLEYIGWMNVRSFTVRMTNL